MIYLIALYCLAGDPPQPGIRPKLEVPACFEHREEYADGLAECSTRGVVAHYRRLSRLYDKPFAFAGAYCKEIKRP
jgi:hypothetical protein